MLLRRVRFEDNCDGAPSFAPSDIIMVNDGGRGGQGFLDSMFVVSTPQLKVYLISWVHVSDAVKIYKFHLAPMRDDAYSNNDPIQETKPCLPLWKRGKPQFSDPKRVWWWFTMKTPSWVGRAGKPHQPHLPFHVRLQAWQKNGNSQCQAAGDRLHADAAKWSQGSQEEQAGLKFEVMIMFI